MDFRERITSNFEVMLGKPVIKGSRITVENVLKKLSEGMSADEILKAYPGIGKEDVMACLAYSAEVISGEEIVAS